MGYTKTAVKATSASKTSSVHRSSGNRKIETDHSFATTRITELDVMIEDTQRVLEEINPNKCEELDGVPPAVLKPLATILSGPVCSLF